MNNNVMTNSVGHYGQAISGGTNTIQLAGLLGQALIGYKIRIIGGTGSGQERTITAVSAPTIHERGMCTSASSTQAIDASTGVGHMFPTHLQGLGVQDADRGRMRAESGIPLIASSPVCSCP
jgi:hypothetical protein